jgi:hypothetical protein
MRVSRTLPALVALLLVTACDASPEVLAPSTSSTSTAVSGDRGPGQIGSGNAVASDSTSTPAAAPAGGIGQFGSGN